MDRPVSSQHIQTIAIDGSPRLNIPMELLQFGVFSTVPNSTLGYSWNHSNFMEDQQ